MTKKIINSREAYTDKELAVMIQNKMKKLHLDVSLLYKKYSKYFLSEEEITLVLSGNVYFNYDIYKFIQEFLDISIDELTKEVEDSSDEVSARGKVNHEDQLMNVLNYLYDQMIKHRRLNSHKKATFNKYLFGAKFLENSELDLEKFVDIFKEEFNIGNKEEDYPLDLFNILEETSGFYILRFPNDFEVSGLTIIKNSIKEDEKYICIYVNTNEPLGRQLFTLSHELYHVLFERSNELASYYKERMKNPIEKRAEEFASRLIIPRDLLASRITELNKSKARSLNMMDIVKLQKQFNVSFQSIIYVLNNTSSISDSKWWWGKFYDELPKPSEKFYRSYKSKEYMSEIAEKTKEYTDLNLIKDDFIPPTLFIKDLEQSLEKNLIDYHEYEEIIKFFRE
ncbi:ImmA/IrrE family metallo-endopeptidase [Clostridium beijerinckii]|uniref:ImmA/IrrE family metallo-endopeptidase n=2 Tax=Clostridium beijerinckii TaxID=1520 RepID=UPI001494F63B|nr:ImmA/IrrE family metallo-endopeptidase [Clostridium beijerinckii]NOW02443.1 Zn-dependent peptidase ImmA (M78 family) [Clostridium beijerinckii]NYC05565.1 Zn-dependent peptidase ImmA (M78 family) [Clostridium beijerinckii]